MKHLKTFFAVIGLAWTLQSAAVRLMEIAKPHRVVLAQSGTIAETVLADITGDAAAHPLSTFIPKYVRIVDVIAAAGNGAAVRLGDSSTSSTRGKPLAAGAAYRYAESLLGRPWDASKIYYYAASGDKITVSYSDYVAQ